MSRVSVLYAAKNLKTSSLQKNYYLLFSLLTIIDDDCSVLKC